MARSKTQRKSTRRKSAARKSPARRSTKAKRSAAAKKAWRTRRRNAGKKTTTKRRASRKGSRKTSTSAKRRTAARKAAATRKRNAAKRSRSAKKAAATRKRNSNKRKGSAKRRTSKRRTSKRRTSKRTGRPTKAKRAAAARKGWRTRRRNGTATKRRSSKRRSSRRRPTKAGMTKMSKSLWGMIKYGTKAGALGLIGLGVFNFASHMIKSGVVPGASQVLSYMNTAPVLSDGNFQAALMLGTGLVGVGMLMQLVKKNTKILSQKDMNLGMAAFAGLLGARMLLQAPLTGGMMSNLQSGDWGGALNRVTNKFSGARSLGYTNQPSQQAANALLQQQGAPNGWNNGNNNSLQVMNQQVPNNHQNLFGTRSRSLRGTVNLF